MNILFLTTHLNAGGITSYLFTLAGGLVHRGHRVHVISGGGDRHDDFRSAGAQVTALKIRTKSELDPRIYCALKPMECYIAQYGIDCIHSQTRITQVMGTLLKKRTGCPHISTCHGFFKRRLSRRLFPCWGEKVIAISSAVKRHLMDDFGVTPDKIILIESGVDLNDFAPVSQVTRIQQRKKYGLVDEPVIGMIARLSEVKGQDILIRSMPQVMTRVPRAKLLLVGEGKTQETLRGMVKRMNLTGHVRFIPLVNKTMEMLQLCDIFVMPSRQEGLGLSIMEAQAFGLPVVASRVGGIPSLIEHGQTGLLVEPENPRALADAIIELCNNPQRSRDIGTAARQFIQKHHSANRMVDETEALYRSVMDS